MELAVRRFSLAAVSRTDTDLAASILSLCRGADEEPIPTDGGNQLSKEADQINADSQNTLA